MIQERLTNANIDREVVANIEVKGNLKVVSGKLKGWSASHEILFVKLDRDYGIGMSEGSVVEIAVAARALE